MNLNILIVIRHVAPYLLCTYVRTKVGQVVLQHKHIGMSYQFSHLSENIYKKVVLPFTFIISKQIKMGKVPKFEDKYHIDCHYKLTLKYLVQLE